MIYLFLFHFISDWNFSFDVTTISKTALRSLLAQRHTYQRANVSRPKWLSARLRPYSSRINSITIEKRYTVDSKSPLPSTIYLWRLSAPQVAEPTIVQFLNIGVSFIRLLKIIFIRKFGGFKTQRYKVTILRALMRALVIKMFKICNLKK